MKWLRILHQGHECWGKFIDNDIEIHTGDYFTVLEQTGIKAGLGDIRLLPAVRPGRVIGIGLNYTDHIREMNVPEPREPVVFYKDPSAVITSGDQIVLPPESGQVEFEGELGVVIRKKCHRIAEYEALDYIAGYICANDITARDLQQTDNQWYRCKSFPTFCSLGNILDDDKIWKNRRLRTWLNGNLAQDASTDDMVFPVPALISFISGFIELNPQDVIMTGTPSGVGRLAANDEVEIEIEGIGKLKNTVKAATHKNIDAVRKGIFAAKPASAFFGKKTTDISGESK